MTAKELSSALDLKVAVSGADDKQISSVYCCDLLSIVMGKAPADSAWVTVMGNMNSVAVASLAEIGAIILADGERRLRSLCAPPMLSGWQCVKST